MKNNQSILKKLENLMQPESTILKSLNSKKNKNDDIVSKKEKNILDKKEKISNLETEITTLKNTSSLVRSSLNLLRDKDLKVLTSVLKLSINPQSDLDKITNQLPLQLSIREQNIKDLETSIKEDTDKVSEIKKENITLEKDLEAAIKNQEALRNLIKEATLSNVNKTREEVVNVLNGVSIVDDEAVEVAKMVMFPEEELRPYFSKFKFDRSKIEEKKVNLDKIDLTKEDSKNEENGSKKAEEETLREGLEDNTPISFEELKNMILDDATTLSEEDNDNTPISLESLNLTEEKIEEPKEENIIIEKEKVNIDEVLKQYQVKKEDLPGFVNEDNVINYLDNIALLKENGYIPSKMKLDKFGINLTLKDKENTKNVLNILNSYNINMALPNSHLALRLLTVDALTLVCNIDVILEVQEPALIINYPSSLASDCHSIAERILFCRKYNIPYKEERDKKVIYRSFIFNQLILENIIEKKVDLELLAKKDATKDLLSKKAVSLLDSKKEELLYTKLKDSTKFDEFNRLETLLESKCVCVDNTCIINDVSFSYQNTKRNLMCLVNSDIKLDDKDILLTSLFYNTNKSKEEYKLVVEGWR